MKSHDQFKDPFKQDNKKRDKFKSEYINVCLYRQSNKPFDIDGTRPFGTVVLEKKIASWGDYRNFVAGVYKLTVIWFPTMHVHKTSSTALNNTR